MRSSWRLGKILGVQVNIDPSWLVIFALITFSLGGAQFPKYYPDWPTWQHWLIGLAGSLLFFCSVLAHELTHSLVAIRQGEKVRNITLFLFGGVAQITEEPDRPAKEFTMAIAGPLSSLAIAVFFGICWLLFRNLSKPLAALGGWLAFINTVLALFNLIPGFPLDGGRVLRAIIWGIIGDLKKATRIASLTGQLVAFLLIVLGIFQIFAGRHLINGLWLIFIGWFLHSAAIRGYHQVVIREMLRDLHAEDLMSRDFEAVSGNLSLEQLVEDHILAKHQHTFVVLDNGRLKGIVSLKDIKKVPREQWSSTTVEMTMIPRDELTVLLPQDNGSLILQRIMAGKTEQLPVIESDRVIGIIHRSHILRRLKARMELGV
jgi:Zn-dependent protease/predicted transcriptional regulator